MFPWRIGCESGDGNRGKQMLGKWVCGKRWGIALDAFNGGRAFSRRLLCESKHPQLHAGTIMGAIETKGPGALTMVVVELPRS